MSGLEWERKRISTETVDNKQKHNSNQSVPVALHLSAVVVTAVMCLGQSAVDHHHSSSDSSGSQLAAKKEWNMRTAACGNINKAKTMRYVTI